MLRPKSIAAAFAKLVVQRVIAATSGTKAVVVSVQSTGDACASRHSGVWQEGGGGGTSVCGEYVERITDGQVRLSQRCRQSRA